MTGRLIGDRLRQTTTTTGTGTVSLIAPATGDVSFVTGVGSGKKVYYVIDDGAGNWEVGLGTVTSGTPDTLSRDTVLNNSLGSTALINFSAGTKTVVCDIPAEKRIPPTRQVFLSGSAATYTTPAGCRQIRVRMKAGGGGGSGTGTVSFGPGGTGGDTIFNSIHAAGGTGGTNASTPVNAPGGSGGAGTASLRIAGTPGGMTGIQVWTATNFAGYGGVGGGVGGGAGSVGTAAQAGGAGTANTGGGGGGGSIPSSTQSGVTTFALGMGGGEGEYAELVIDDPAATYTYTVAAGGSAGSAGTSGAAGGAGGSGYIIVEEFY